MDLDWLAAAENPPRGPAKVVADGDGDLVHAKHAVGERVPRHAACLSLRCGAVAPIHHVVEVIAVGIAGVGGDDHLEPVDRDQLNRIDGGRSIGRRLGEVHLGLGARLPPLSVLDGDDDGVRSVDALGVGVKGDPSGVHRGRATITPVDRVSEDVSVGIRGAHSGGDLPVAVLGDA